MAMVRNVRFVVTSMEVLISCAELAKVAASESLVYQWIERRKLSGTRAKRLLHEGQMDRGGCPTGGRGQEGQEGEGVSLLICANGPLPTLNVPLPRPQGPLPDTLLSVPGTFATWKEEEGEGEGEGKVKSTYTLADAPSVSFSPILYQNWIISSFPREPSAAVQEGGN